mmetsp:Transcript_40508/g.39011  ORF Transcript_40508/g.39011 Transcript_40508/m.39011 type:complete len:99 (+) Transcript_40508:487-783(+)
MNFGNDLFYSLYGNFYHFNGSLSWPPCTENVRWFVFSVNQQFSVSQYNAFSSVLSGSSLLSGSGGNYRSQSDQNGRTVYLISKMSGPDYERMQPWGGG